MIKTTFLAWTLLLISIQAYGFAPFFDDDESTVYAPELPEITAFDQAVLKVCGYWGATVERHQLEELFADHPELIQTLYKQLDGRIKLQSDINGFTTELIDIWQNNHAFEHVFCGEPSNKKLGGFHYYPRFHQAQVNGWAGPCITNQCLNDTRVEILPESGVFSYPVKYKKPNGKKGHKGLTGYNAFTNAEDILFEATTALKAYYARIQLSRGGCIHQSKESDSFPAHESVLAIQQGAIITYYPVGPKGRDSNITRYDNDPSCLGPSEHKSSSNEKTSQSLLSMATWNVRNLSDKSRSDAELGIISLIVSRYDFIALQEVLDPAVIKRIADILRSDFQLDYNYTVSKQVGTDKNKERYAFLWRANKVTKGDSFIVDDTDDHFIREPYCANFKAENFDWLACNIHVLWGNSVKQRRLEIQRLDEVYESLQHSMSERDIILMGDFNFSPLDKGWEDFKAKDEMRFAIAPPLKTTISNKSLYDNIWWSKYTKEIIKNSGSVYYFDTSMYPPNSRKTANRLTSDHRPVNILVDLSGGDDD